MEVGDFVFRDVGCFLKWGGVMIGVFGDFGGWKRTSVSFLFFSIRILRRVV